MQHHHRAFEELVNLLTLTEEMIGTEEGWAKGGGNGDCWVT